MEKCGLMKPILATCKTGFLISIDRLKPLQGNLKDLSKENYTKLKNEILTEGFDAPFFVWIDSNEDHWLLDGHQRLRTLSEMRTEGFEIPELPMVPVLATDEKEARRKLLGLASQYGEVTSQGLYEFLSASDIAFDEMESRYRFPEIENEDFKDEFYADPVVEGEDDVPDLAESTVVQLGDLFRCGEHTLLCGDSTDISQVERLMNGEKADMVYTDPPYGISVVNNSMVGADFGVAKKGKYHSVIGDETVDTAVKAFTLFNGIAPTLIFFGGNYYANELPPSKCWLIWDKRNESGIENTFADAEIAWTNLSSATRIYRQLWNGMIRSGEKDKRIHPTQKPIALAEWCLNKAVSNLVIDPFLGSGSTLIACEKTNRKCYGMEIDPHYCSVIIERWQKFTGKQAYRQEADGSMTSYDSLKADLIAI